MLIEKALNEYLNLIIYSLKKKRKLYWNILKVYELQVNNLIVKWNISVTSKIK